MHVDALSRNPVAEEENYDLDQYPTTVLSIVSNEDWLQTLQLGDSELRRTRDILTTEIDTEKLKYIRTLFTPYILTTWDLLSDLNEEILTFW